MCPWGPIVSGKTRYKSGGGLQGARSRHEAMCKGLWDWEVTPSRDLHDV